jgi:hypothetical protein
MGKIKVLSSNFLKSKLHIFGLFLVGFFLPVIFAYGACTEAELAAGKVCNPINANSIQGLIKTVLESVIKIGIPVIALAIIYSGFLFIKARGNSEEIGKAKDALMYTLIGAAILLGSWALAQLISDTVLSL